jgi:hypothetical protein
MSMVSMSMTEGINPGRLAADEHGSVQNRLMNMASGTATSAGARPNPFRRFSQPPPPLGTPISASMPAPTAWPTMLAPELSDSLTRIEQRLGKLESKSFYDNMMMATMKEEQDTEANKAMLDRVTVLGIRIPNLSRMKDKDKIEPMRNKIQEVFDKLADEGQKFVAGFVRHLNRQIRGNRPAVIEVKVESGKQAEEIRKNFIKRKDERDFEGVNIVPTVRQSTRVRVEIMLAAATLIKQQDSTVTKIQCLQYIPKPVLKITREDREKQEYTRYMSFIEVVIWIKENGKEKVINLRKARDRAGASFRNTLQQTFVIMD